MHGIRDLFITENKELEIRFERIDFGNERIKFLKLVCWGKILDGQ